MPQTHSIRNGHNTRTLTVLLATMLLVVSATSFAHAGGPKDKSRFFDFVTGEAVTGTFSQLERTEDAVVTKVRTSVESGHAFTVWYVIFNDPAACVDAAGATGDCDELDLFIDGDEAAGFNTTQIAAARISVVFGGAGGVANPGGRLNIEGGLAEGEIGGPGQVLIGLDADGSLVPEAVTGAVVTGLEDAGTAEVHLVVQDHGPAHDDADLLEEQITTFHGACNPDCVDVQFSVHK